LSTKLAVLIVALGIVAAMNTSLPEGASAQAPQPQVCSPDPYHQFDFWLGKWEVTEKGKVAGINRIESILGGCALLESWQGASGFRGNSINFYDAPRGVWHQTWIDHTGGALLLEGRFENGVMRLEGQRPGDKAGEVQRHRITWTPLPDGKLRQLWESSVDGTTWKPVFDGLYAPAR
jgi:hypothetical protein